jgi:hypothetical protein
LECFRGEAGIDGFPREARLNEAARGPGPHGGPVETGQRAPVLPGGLPSAGKGSVPDPGGGGIAHWLVEPVPAWLPLPVPIPLAGQPFPEYR